ncbi:type IV pilus biogenesis/stability protein PilW [Aliikangiella sp. IMCC44632]
MIRITTVIILMVLLAACETTRNTQTANIGTSSQPLSERKFDRKKAAEKRVGYALTYINARNFKRAKYHLDKALEYNSDSGNVHYALGIYFQRVGDLKQSERHFKRALSEDKKRPEYLNAYGAFLCEKGEYKEADKLFMRAIDVPTYTDVASAYFNVGLCAITQGNVEKASEYFRKSLSRDRRRPDALIEMAKIEFGLKRYNRAMDYLQRFESNANTTAESAWLGLRIAHFVRDKDAIGKYGVILEQRFPDSDETVAYLENKKRWM